MPHLVIEYSANLEPALDADALAAAAHAALTTAGPFTVGSARTRVVRHSTFAVADDHPDNGFVHLALTIGAGRDEATKRAAGDHIFDAVRNHCAVTLGDRPVALSFYIFEADPALSWKHNPIHDVLASREGPP